MSREEISYQENAKLERILKLREELGRMAMGSGVSDYGLAFLDAYEGRTSWTKFLDVHNKTKLGSLSNVERDVHSLVPSLSQYLGDKR